MDHIVYLDFKANELDSLLTGNKTMLIRGATGRKMPYGRVSKKDELYFINNNGEGVVKAKATVLSVFNSEKLEKEESASIVEKEKNKLCLTPAQMKRWKNKRYLVLIEVSDVQSIEPFTIDKSRFSNMDDWLLVENIDLVRVK